MRKGLLCVILCMLVTASVNAALLQWDGTKWPHGALSESYTISGTSVNVAFTGAVGSLYSSHPVAYNKALPSDDWNRNYWTPAAPDALWWGNSVAVTEASPLNLTIHFSSPVTALQFSLYDLDTTELVYFSAGLNGTGVDPSAVSHGSIVYTPETGRLYGNGINGNPGDTINTATITFMNPVDTVILSYSAPAGSGTMLGNISFVPEPVTLLLLGTGALGLLGRRSKK